MNEKFEINGKTFTFTNEINRRGEPVVVVRMDGNDLVGSNYKVTTLENGEYHCEVVTMTYPSGKQVDELYIKNAKGEFILNINNLA